MERRHNLVVVIDFGAQYAQLIARRVREARVFSEIMPHTASVADILAKRPTAIILSGGPQSVYAPEAPQVDPALFSTGLPASASSAGPRPRSLPKARCWLVCRRRSMCG